MRHATCLLTALLAAGALPGCRDSQRARRQEAADRIEEARRLYQRATSLLANPTYIDAATGLPYATSEKVVLTDGSSYVGRVTRTDTGYRIVDRASGKVNEVPAARVERITYYETPANEILLPVAGAAATGTGPPSTGPAATRPDVGREALKDLDAAAGRIADVLKEHPEMDAGARAHAELLLGRVLMAKGQHHMVTSERLRGDAGRLRRDSRGILAQARDTAIMADFNAGLAGTPRDEVVKMINDTAAQLADLDKKIKAVTDERAKLTAEIDKLAAASGKLRQEARRLRDRSHKARGQEGLDLLTRAQQRESKINDNTREIQLRQDRLEALKIDEQLLRQQREGLQRKVAAMKGHLDSMDRRTTAASQAVRDERAEAGRVVQRAASTAEKLVEVCDRLRAEERRALDAMGKAVEQLATAIESIRAEREAAARATGGGPGPLTPIAEDLADDQHLASTIALRAGARCAVADVHRYRTITARDNAVLADTFTALAGKIGRDPPDVGSRLRGYLPDPADARKRAVDHYTAAEDALEKLLGAHLKRGTGRNVRWIYEAQLANAYLGHYGLTGDAVVLGKAKTFVDQALAGKAQSPFLASVRQLKAMIASAGGGSP